MSNPQKVSNYPAFTGSHRDEYGRTCHTLRSFPNYRTLGVVVRLPKCAIESRTDGAKYLVNNWTKEDRFPNGLEGENTAVSYHPTLAAAKAALLTQVAA